MAGGINEDGVALGRRRFSLAPRRRLSSAREILPRAIRRTRKGNSIDYLSNFPFIISLTSIPIRVVS